MAIVFFLFWLLLNAHFALDTAMLQIVIIGILLSLLLYIFMIKFTRWDKKLDRFFICNPHLFLLYGAVLFWNVLVSNFHVIKLLLTPGESPEPCIVIVEIPLKNEMLRSMLANSITLTPGTITVESNESSFTVHCLKKGYIDGIEASTLTKILMKMEEKLK